MSDSLPISRRRDLGLGATLAAGVGLSACGEGGDKGGGEGALTHGRTAHSVTTT